MTEPYKTKPKKVWTLADLKSHKEGEYTLYTFPDMDGQYVGEEYAIMLLRIANLTGELTCQFKPQAVIEILDRLEVLERHVKCGMMVLPPLHGRTA